MTNFRLNWKISGRYFNAFFQLYWGGIIFECNTVLFDIATAIYGEKYKPLQKHVISVRNKLFFDAKLVRVFNNFFTFHTFIGYFSLIEIFLSLFKKSFSDISNSFHKRANFTLTILVKYLVVIFCI